MAKKKKRRPIVGRRKQRRTKLSKVQKRRAAISRKVSTRRKKLAQRIISRSTKKKKPSARTGKKVHRHPPKGRKRRPSAPKRKVKKRKKRKPKPPPAGIIVEIEGPEGEGEFAYNLRDVMPELPGRFPHMTDVVGQFLIDTPILDERGRRTAGFRTHTRYETFSTGEDDDDFWTNYFEAVPYRREKSEGRSVRIKSVSELVSKGAVA